MRIISRLWEIAIVDYEVRRQATASPDESSPINDRQMGDGWNVLILLEQVGLIFRTRIPDSICIPST